MASTTNTKVLYIRILKVLFVLLLPLLGVPDVIAQDAESVFAAAGQRVFQILIIDTESSEKSSIGSGFLLDSSQLLVTNFHVIADAVDEPAKYRIEAKNHAGGTWNLEVADFDLVNDLALLHSNDLVELPAALPLAVKLPEQGEQIYALGNPFDLGKTIIPGTFNGLLEHRFYQKLHFSGSLNPGMSGGPAVSAAGEVVGVNVASAGNQVSFLVPIEYLVQLLDKYKSRGAGLTQESFAQEIDDQLFADQKFKFDLIMQRDWGGQLIGKVRIGESPAEFFRCWGDTDDSTDRYQKTTKRCSSQDGVYVKSSFTTGMLGVEYAWLSTDQLSVYRFHKLLGEHFSYLGTPSWKTEDDVTEYQCHRSFVAQQKLAPNVLRAMLCVRQYKNYPRLFDVIYLGLLLGDSKSAFASKFTLSGVSKDKALAFTKRFLAMQSWAL